MKTVSARRLGPPAPPYLQGERHESLLVHRRDRLKGAIKNVPDALWKGERNPGRLDV
jgi:hypothetical protein